MVLAVLTPPRFVVAETHGWRQGGPTSTREGVAALVLDRWYCHRVVAEYACEPLARGFGHRAGLVAARERADTHAERLNRG